MLQFNHISLKSLLLTALLLVNMQLYAQDANTGQNDRALLQQVEDQYSMGHFEEVVQQLDKELKRLTGLNLVSAYRLLALCSLQLDANSDAEYYTQQLLDSDPYYTTTLQDPPRFVDLVNRFKSSGARISTASFQNEGLEESPVPVTLITEDMIIASGARTLAELLALYVPGMNEVGGIEANTSFRGIYSMRQENMLVMLDGHRLNSHSSNSESLDFRTDIHKIKQIEILRGPASSLYGNVALTATINIITKNGGDYDGLDLHLKAGSHDSYGVSFVGGKAGANFDFLAWGSIYTSMGEKYVENGRHLIIDRYNGGPSYDLGMKAHWNSFFIQLTAQSSKRVPLFNLTQAAPDFDYDRYLMMDGVKPGMSYSNLHGTVGYQQSWRNLSVNVELFGDKESCYTYNVAADTLDYESALAFHKFMWLDSLGLPVMNRGICQGQELTTYTVGVNSRFALQYKVGNKAHGTLLAGVNFERFDQLIGDLKLADNFGERILMTYDCYNKGSESTISGFAQLKHNFNQHFILNSGVRYDHKVRYDNTTYNHVSPRLSFIYLPNGKFTFKAGWAHSFVDAPYVYRSSIIPFYRGVDLQPETLNSTQVGFSYNNKRLHLRYELNAFHSQADNLVHLDLSKLKNNYTFTNSGTVSTIGLENVLEYNTSKTLANVNMILQRALSVEGLNLSSKIVDESIQKGRIQNIPNFAVNATISQKVIDHKVWGKIWLRGNIHFQSATYMENLSEQEMQKAINGLPFDVTLTTLPAYAKVNAGMDYVYKKIRLSFNAYNLFDYHSHISGSILKLTPQAGFRFLGSLSIRF